MTPLSATLTLGNAQFNAAVEESQAKTNTFQNVVGGGTGNFIKLNTHMLESRRTMRLLGEAAGANLTPVLHLSHAFGTFGIGAGGAVAGFMLLQEYIASTSEKLKKATEDQNEFTNVLRKHRMESEGLHFSKATEEAAELGKEVTKITTKMREMEEGSVWSEIVLKLGHFTALANNSRMDALMKEAREQNMDTPEYKALQSQMKLAQGDYKRIHDTVGGPEHSGSAQAHILRAVHGQELGALKLEHSNPMVDLLKRSVDLQEKTLKVLENHGAGEPAVQLAP